MSKLYDLLNYQCFNVEKIGKDSINGRVSFAGNSTPADNTRVVLIDQLSIKVICSFFTDKNGNYTFNNIDLESNVFFVVTHDKTKKNNGVIADNIGGKNVDD